jgi:putative sugar O-methyltransferase
MSEDIGDLTAATNAMMDELETDPIFLPSNFWRDLNAKNVRMLELEGLSNFKRTLSQNYYNWLITSGRHPQFKHVLKDWIRNPTLNILQSRIDAPENIRVSNTDNRLVLKPRELLTYRLFVTALWAMMKRADRAGLHKRVGEPLTGNPIRIWQGSTLISQDLASSIMECNIVIDALKGASKTPRVAEIGAGYGRLAHVYAATQPGQYFIFDIPPALHVSQWYAQQVLGETKVFKFRHFDRLEDVADEMAAASVVFLTANQIKKFPDRYFDMVLSISTLPEMRDDQARLYIELMQKLARHAIFLKQWSAWENTLDQTQMDINSYKFGSDWGVTLDQTDAVEPRFFNRVWRRT